MTNAAPSVFVQLRERWVDAAVYTGAVLLALAPLVWRWGGESIVLIYLCGPAYIAHQIEEHWGDRFRRFVNDHLFGGRDVLTPGAVWWINLPGVWGVNLAALHAAVFWGPGWGLAAPYLMLVNGVAHGGAALRFGYNPGLATSLLLFFPLGLYAAWVVPATEIQHAVGLGIAVAIHAVIVIAVARRAAA